MTNQNQAELVSAVERIGAELEQAQRDVALLQRLKAAEANAERLAAELRKAQDELAEAMAAEVRARLDAKFAGFHDITVTESNPHNSSGVLQTAFGITVTRQSFNGYGEAPETFTYAGFRALPSDALEYLVVKHPERIPASIMELAPNDPEEAFGAYFMGLRRGYLSVRTA